MGGGRGNGGRDDGVQKESVRAQEKFFTESRCKRMYNSAHFEGRLAKFRPVIKPLSFQ